MLFTFLLVLQALIGAALVTVILMQRSEGGGLTSSGSSGLMSARGAADFLTRSTAVLASVFVSLAILMAFLAAGRHSTSVDTSLNRSAVTRAPQDGDAGPAGGDALSGAAANAAAAGNSTSPNVEPGNNDSVPLAR